MSININTIKDEGEGRSRFDQIKYRFEKSKGRFVNMMAYVPQYYNPYFDIMPNLKWSDLKTMLEN